jgi:flagellar FliL protein
LQYQQTITTLLTAVLLVFSIACSSQASADDEENKVNVQYVDLKPAFVANFGGPAKKLKFIKADISLRVHSPENAALVEQHMPLIRNEIVLLLSAQEEKEISTIQGQEKVRLEALENVKKVLEEETGSTVAEDLLFTNFVLQR